MNYDKHDLEDFLLDTKFRMWVLEPNPELHHYWDRWLREHPDKKSLVDNARDILIATNSGVPLLREDKKMQLWHKIREESVGEKSGPADTTPMHAIRNRGKDNLSGHIDLGLIMKIAAGILLLATVGFLSYRQISTSQQLPAERSMIVKRNPPGQKSKIFLPDGSVLHLNAGSSIEYPSSFETNARTVQLQGEAYFEVVTDSLRPFYVVTESLVTTVLGTSFNVHAFTESDDTQVALVSGKVEVAARDAGQAPMLLTPGEMAAFSVRDPVLKKRGIDVEDIVAWKDGVIVFDNTTIDSVFMRLENWYGVDIVVEGAPGKRININSSFDNATMDNVLNSIGFTAGFSYSIQDNKVSVTFNQTPM